jgi:glycosyltransferase involved in cell wall biosynthesis
MINQNYPGRLGLQQRTFPYYRAPFFEALAEACQGGLSVFAGLPASGEYIASGVELKQAQLVQSVNLNIFPIHSPFYQCWQKGLLKWLKTWSPDALVVEANTRYPSTRLAVRWMHARNRPVLGWGLGTPPIPVRTPLQKALAPWRRWERWSLLTSLDGLIAYSRRGAAQYEQLGIPSEKIFVAPNAAVHPPSEPVPAGLSTLKDNPTVLFVGRLQARKRIDLLLEACASLPAGIQPKLLIVGDGPARHTYESQARSVYPKAVFVGEKRGSALIPLFQEADLFVLPGTGGLAVQQAMAYGLPVIVAEGDGTQDDLVRPENGIQVPPGDKTALIEAMTFILSDLARMRNMGKASYLVVKNEVNLSKMVEGFIQALNSVFEHRRN